MSPLLRWVKRALEDGQGLPSAMRLHLFMVTLIAGFLPIIIWTAACFMKREMVDIPAGVSTFCGLLIGSAAAAKAAQTFGE